MTNTQTLAPAQQLAETNKAHFPNESAAYRKARNALLIEEIELRRHMERVASQRRALPPGGEIPRDFEFVSEQGPPRLSELFGNRSTLMVYSMMYGPQRKAPCPMCTSFLSSWNGTAVNLRGSASPWSSLPAPYRTASRIQEATRLCESFFCFGHVRRVHPDLRQP
jgi:predicted dithiol-disulfide oxidoreductase (DUF899 family)